MTARLCYWDPQHPDYDKTTPLFSRSTLTILDDIIEEELAQEEWRGYLGFSEIGNPDDRELWFKYRKLLPNDITPGKERLFGAGHILEDYVATLLRKIPGVTLLTLDPNTGRQFEYSISGHMGGHMDGAILGIFEAPKTWHNWENKTAKEEKFRELVKLQSYKEWNLQYWVQTQMYMKASGLTRSYVTVYNKNNSAIYAERIKLEPEVYRYQKARGKDIILATEPPPSIYPKKNHYEIKIRFRKEQAVVYWLDELPQDVHCRGCRFAEPDLTAGAPIWTCLRHNKPLTVRQQMLGCTDHNWLPSLFPTCQPTQIFYNCIEYRTADGATFWNAPDSVDPLGENVFSSAELVPLSRIGLNKKNLQSDLARMRMEFAGRFEK